MRQRFFCRLQAGAVQAVSIRARGCWLALACALHTAPACAFHEGQAVHRERTVPPPAAVLTASAGTAAPADAPADLVQPCARDGTQSALNQCAYETFLETSAALSQQLRQLDAGLAPTQRKRWQSVQKSWLAYRTKACEFEASLLDGGSAQPMMQWQCAARMTRERATELSRFMACSEGDLACPFAKQTGKTTP